MEIQTLYQRAIAFATYRHLEKKQKVTGTNLPYVVHLSNVSMEIFIAAINTEDFNLEFAIQVALLHDTIEDTLTTFEEIEEYFGLDIAEAVLALTKNDQLPEEQQTLDSINRIKKLPEEIWAVKLADRITNLQPPPSGWNNQKRIKYQEKARLILNELKYGNGYLAKRLKEKIEEYCDYIDFKTQIQEDHHC
jgi:guanosine-3',5'-bis(diphosphate) 3'-pyrophosphohydrolase